MAKTPIFAEQPKKHPNLPDLQEGNERLMRQAEDENREFYEINQQVAANVTNLQTGINEQVLHALTRGIVPQPAVADRVKEERVQAELYRAVQGNEIYETELGEDPRHYLGSENVQHLQRNLQRRMGRQVVRVARGAAAMVGFNNMVEATLVDRFGPNRNIIARRDFVATQRLQPDLAALPGWQFNAIATRFATVNALPLAATPLALAQQLAAARLSALRDLRDWCQDPTVDIPFVANESYLDLMLLVDLDQRVSSKTGMAEVYEEQTLRNFWNDLEFGLPPNPRARNLKRAVLNALEPNAIFPMRSHEESIALVAELRSRINMYQATGLAANANLAMTMIRREVRDIVAREVGDVPRTSEEQEAINALQREVSRMVRAIRQNLTALQTLDARRTAITAALGAVPPPAPQVAGKLNAELATIQGKIAEATSNVKNLAQELADLFSSNGIDHRRQWPPPNNAIIDALGTPDFLVPANIIPKLTTDFNQMATDIAQDINKVKPLKKAKLTPFQLLQRLMRRDYARERSLNPREYNEEANRYAALKAAMRVEDVKSVDRMRSANDRAAEYMRRGLARRGWDRLKKAVSKSQDIVGLEAIDFANMTADKLLKQVINSSPDFAVFRGVNKFTTSRDLRHILNKKGQKVPREVVERFARILEEALSRYKMVVPALDKGVNSEDWDLEILIEPLKKLKLEMWAEDVVAQANASNAPNREKALVALLRGAREREEQIEDEILEEVKHPDAAWRVQLVKKNLKRILNREALEGLNKIKQEGVEEKKRRIAQLETQLAANPEGSPARVKIQQDIDNLRSAINVAEAQIAQAADLHDRVKKAREYIKTNKLSRREKREYLESVGLTQVFDKMSQNFRMENAWEATKKASKTAAKAFWSASSRAWKWSRKKFLNAKTAKSIGSKTYSIGRLAATPITAPLGWAWKAGTFPFRLVGRAMSRSVDAPWWLAGQVNKTALRRFYRVRVIDETSRMEKLVAKRNALIKSLESAPYSWDKKRIAERMNRLEEKIYAINTTANEVRKSALENKVDLGEMAVYSEVANDNGEIIIKKAA